MTLGLFDIYGYLIAHVLVSLKTVSQILISDVIRFNFQIPFWILGQIRKECICIKGFVDVGYVNVRAFVEELLVDFSSTDDIKGRHMYFTIQRWMNSLFIQIMDVFQNFFFGMHHKGVFGGEGLISGQDDI